MKNFLAVYMGTQESREKSGWDRLPEAQRKEREMSGIQAWGAWMGKHQADIAYTGGPLGKTKKIAKGGISDIKNAMTGFVVVQAESHDAAARLFENHPHFAIFPGDSVEIMECLPIPGQT